MSLHSQAVTLTPLSMTPVVWDDLPTKYETWLTDNPDTRPGGQFPAQIKAILVGALERRPRPSGDNPFFARAIMIVTVFGRGFVGVARDHGNPPESGAALRGAIAAMVASGQIGRIHSVFVLDDCPGRTQMLSPADIGMLGRFVVPDDSILVMGISGGHSRSQIITGSVCHGLLWDDETVRLHLSVPQQPMSLLWQSDVPYMETHPDTGLITAVIERLLKPIVGNSTCDGRTRPATKRHAAAAVNGNQIALAVNVRDPDWPDQVRCSEMGLAAICATLGISKDHNWATWPLTIVYSPDYRLTTGQLGQPCVCSSCLGILGQHSVGGAMLVVTTNGEDFALHQLPDLLPHSYAKNEACVVKGNNS